jgi:hypothetical protein
VLSEGSIATMDDALCRQEPVEDLEFGAARETDPLADPSVTPEVVEVDPPTRFGTIEDVLGLLPGGSAGCSSP